MLSISRAVEVNPLGPLQAQLPPVSGCGPRLTVAAVEVTVALVSSIQTPFVEIYGVIVVAVQVLPLLPELPLPLEIPLQAVTAVANTDARTIPNILKIRRFMVRSLTKILITNKTLRHGISYIRQLCQENEMRIVEV
jgi:hypothetical protein